MVDQGALAGSGGSHRPGSAPAALTSLLTAPGWTTASRLSGSTSSTWFMAAMSSTTQPATALAPPDSPVPAPRGTTGTPRSAQVRTTCWTSASVRARTPAAAPPPPAPGPAGRRPLGVVGGQGVQHVRVGHDPVRGQAPVQGLQQLGFRPLGLGRLAGHSTSESRFAVARAPAGLMIDAAWSTPATVRTAPRAGSRSRKRSIAAGG